MIYWRAAHAGFHALVARDRAQLDQTLEMYVLSQLPNFAVITWRKHVEDPIREWGQLLAYLPEIKRVLRHRGARAILLPAPTLQPGNLINPTDTIGTDATQRGISHGQARGEVRAELQRWLDEHGHALRVRTSPPRPASLTLATAVVVVTESRSSAATGHRLVTNDDGPARTGPDGRLDTSPLTCKNADEAGRQRTREH